MPVISLTERIIGMEFFTDGFWGILTICFALIIPGSNTGSSDGANIQERIVPPIRNKMTNTINTSIIKANVATTLFEFKNSSYSIIYTIN